jgi:nucleolar MIF4G domain-containing protein 1
MVNKESQETSRKALRKQERSKKKLHNKRYRDEGRTKASSVVQETPKSTTPTAISTKVKKTGSKRSNGPKHEHDADADTSVEHTGMSNKATSKKKRQRSDDDPYANLSPDVAAALRRDDEEIADLEAKLGGSKEKSRLNKEYATLECYGDDFGDFLDDIDSMVQRVRRGDDGDDDDDMEGNRTSFGASSDSDEEVVPMKAPAFDDYGDNADAEMASDAESDEDQDGSEDSRADEEESNEAAEADDYGNDDADAQDDQSAEDENENSESDGDSEDEDVAEPDHDVALTYKPSQGEDIYGKSRGSTESDSKPKKYVPPHLRNKEGGAKPDNDAQRQESLRVIQRSLNSSLNRLSEDTLVPVAQSIAKLYESHPTSDVNECIWENTKNACMARSHLMAGLIPVYVAALAGIHIDKGDSVQLGEYLLENTVLELQGQLKTARAVSKTNLDDTKASDAVDKEVCNRVLVLCYLYNYGIVHCTLIYDIVRDFIDSFAEIDVELLLLVLGHCGRALRSDDPSALKEIILLVQKKAAANVASASYSSRIEYMISAINDLKNNKRRQQDSVYADKTAKLRKLLGRIKANKTGTRSADTSLRISVQDIINAETKGRWWKVGASWVGNQHDYKGGETEDQSDTGGSKGRRSSESTEEDEKLLKLAAKYRMNTDIRRSIFCIIMGSADCDDSFEKLVRGGMLKNKSERETARVLMECCGNEKSYNKFYSFLASKIIDYQQKCKFTFQLAFWDTFKQFESLKARKAANLAKLLFHLVVVHRSLKLNVLKAIDMSSPDEMSESAMIFLTIFLSSILEHFGDPSEVTQLFESGIGHRKATTDETDTQEDDMDHMDDGDSLRASITVFFMQVLKASPKNKKGSKFKANLKAAIKACDTDNFF